MMAPGRCYKELFFILVTIVTVGVLMTLLMSPDTRAVVAFKNHTRTYFGALNADNVGPTIFDVIPEEEPSQTLKSSTTTQPTQDVDKLSTQNQRHDKTHVLLLTEGRSGSTWLSSFFWFRKEVYYVFEPLYYTGSLKAAKCHDTAEKRAFCDAEVLGHLWGCNFNSSRLSVLGRYPTYRLNCTARKCDTNSRQEYCRSSTHVVAKTILLFDLENIASIMKDPTFNVKVIHLVRDPRPLAHSRMKGGFGSLDGLHKHPSHGYTDEGLEEEVSTLCKRMLRAAKLGDNPPDWLKDRYLRISHEDMSLEPLKTAETIYNFVNLSWDGYSKEYIYNTTVGAVGKGGMFGIKRISAEIIEKWKTSMTPEHIQIITDSCKDTLEYLGYETDLVKLFSEDSIDGG